MSQVTSLKDAYTLEELLELDESARAAILNELSKETMMNYYDRAQTSRGEYETQSRAASAQADVARGRGARAQAAGQTARAKIDRRYANEKDRESKAMKNRANKRSLGIARARTRLTKEEFLANIQEMDEQGFNELAEVVKRSLNELSNKTMSSYRDRAETDSDRLRGDRAAARNTAKEFTKHASAAAAAAARAKDPFNKSKDLDNVSYAKRVADQATKRGSLVDRMLAKRREGIQRADRRLAKEGMEDAE